MENDMIKPSEKVLKVITERWNISENLVFVRKVENWIFHAPQAKLFIRVTNPSHKNKEDIISELTWLKHLEGCGVKFAHPVTSQNGHLVESIEDEQRFFYTSVFKEAQGKPLKTASDFTDDVFTAWGKALGKIHAASKSYVLPDGIIKRDEWNTEKNHRGILERMKPSDGGIYKRANELIETFGHLPKSIDDYGLIHSDLHKGNFHIHEGSLIAFDFDDCLYHWFAYDVGVIFFYLEDSEFLQSWDQFEELFWAGYRLENGIKDEWYKLAHMFSDYRAILIYYWCQHNLEKQSLSENAVAWMKKKMKWCEENMI